jgi:sulfofructose kinase
VVLCDVRWPKASQVVLQTARDQGVTTVLDADLTSDDAVERLIGFADYSIFSAPALERLSGTPDFTAGLRIAQERTSGIVGVTLGEDGFAWLDEGDLHACPAFRVATVDTLAAGDVFHGAFALAIGEGLATADAGRLASAAAALKCTRWGGRAGIPNRTEVEQFLASSSPPAASKTSIKIT